MRLTCPHCGFHASLEAFLLDTDAKAAVVAASALPGDLGRLVWSYLGLFRKPDAKQVMTWQRAGRLIQELHTLVNDPQIQWDGGRVVPGGAAYWGQAIQRVLDMTVNQIGSIEFNMSGIYVDPLDQIMPTPTILDLVPPACAGIGLTLGSYTPVLSSLQLSLGNQIVQRKDLNADTGITGISIIDRQPAGSVDPEAAKLSDFNPWSAWSAGTRASISATLGSASGNKIAITVPKAQYGGPKYGDRDGTLVYELPFTPTIDATGDDELKLEFL